MRKKGASFLRGLFSAARDIVLVGSEFVKITDKLIRALPMDSFIEVLPELRLAFSYFTPNETDSIAQKAAEIYDTSKGDIKKTTEIYNLLYATGSTLEKQILKEMEAGK